MPTMANDVAANVILDARDICMDYLAFRSLTPIQRFY